MRAEVSLAARYPETVPAPVSGKPTRGVHPLRDRGRLHGPHPNPDRVAGPGHDRLPLRPGADRRRRNRAAARERLCRSRSTRSSGSSPSPPTTSAASGRSISAGLRSAKHEIDARELLRIVESSMSLENYELMKREDERSVVEKAHANPRFVEDASARWSASSPPPTPIPTAATSSWPPGEPGDDPPPQRRGRALRRALARSSPSSIGGALARSHDDARVAGRSRFAVLIRQSP